MQINSLKEEVSSAEIVLKLEAISLTRPLRNTYIAIWLLPDTLFRG